MLRRVLLLTAVVTLAGVTGSPAQGPGVPGLSASRPQLGWISLTVTGTPGSTAAISDTTPSWAVPIGTVALPATGTVPIARSARWACAPTTRPFAALLTLPDGAQQTAGATIPTPPCAN